jgi:flagellar hook-associated protein 1 FlgK
MAGAFQGISTMNSALRAFQRALDVTGHNITNVNTAGYSRQSVQFNDFDPSKFGEGGRFIVGTGVTAASVSRIQDQFLFMRQAEAMSEDGRLSSLHGGLSGVQSVMQEPGGASVGDALNKLFNAFSALGSNPGDAALRNQVQQAGQTLSSRIRGMYSNLDEQSKFTQTLIKSTLGQAQDLANSIATMNGEIRSATANGQTPSDLMDMRDEAVRQLSTIMPVTIYPQPDGGVSLFSGQLTLVDSEGAETIPTTFNAAAGTLSDGTNTYPVSSGSLAGLFQTSQKIAGYQQQLDSFANSLRTEFNSVHMTGTNGLGATGVKFFNDSAPQSGAIDFDLDPAILADARAIATGVSGNPGDGGLALSMSALRDSSVAALGGKTFTSFYANLVSSVGQDVATTEGMLDTSSAILGQISEQVQSVSGVSLDEEMSNMLRFQRSYQAAAKALSILDQTTEDLMNIIR